MTKVRPDLGYSSLRPDSLSQLAAGGNATRLFEGVLRLETANLPCTGELENCAAEPFYKSSQSTVPAPCVQMGGIQPWGWVGQGTEQSGPLVSWSTVYCQQASLYLGLPG